jgi:predicted PurR-regulated permease PerM
MICATVLTLAGLWAARAVITPVAFALFIIAIVWPLQRRLQAVLPQPIAVLVTAGAVLLAIGGGGWLAVWGFGGIVGLNLLQFVIGSYIEPRVAGTAVAVSPFMVLFAVFFWGMLWGVAGAFIGVPILIALATVCAGHPASRPIAVLLSAGGATQMKTDQ